MPDLSAAGQVSKQPQVFDYVRAGTVAGTLTVQSEPGFLHSVLISTRVASGVITLYDSIGTSGTVIDTITVGSQTFSDPQNAYLYDVRTKNGLTVVNTANLGAMVAYGK
jgi:hypothetical protein